MFFWPSRKLYRQCVWKKCQKLGKHFFVGMVFLIGRYYITPNCLYCLTLMKPTEWLTLPIFNLVPSINVCSKWLKYQVSLGTIHILHKHIFKSFGPPFPLCREFSLRTLCPIFSTERKQKLPFSSPLAPLYKCFR